MLPFVLAGIGYAIGLSIEKNNKKELTPGTEIDTSNNHTKNTPGDEPAGDNKNDENMEVKPE